MKLSTRATYGMRLCFMLALSKTPLSASQLVKQTDVGMKYLEQLMSMLKRGGIVNAFRGKSGGYVLARDAREITVNAMLNALDDGFVAPECVMGDCKDMYCPNRNVLNKLSNEINRVFDGITLADIVADYRNNCGAAQNTD